MNVLHVQCETCQATLRVRDEGFVGEVHACPRCGSMVLIGGGGDHQADPSSEPTPTEAPTTLLLSDTLEADPLAADGAATGPNEAATPANREAESADPPAAALTAAGGWAPLATTVVSLMATGALVAVWVVSGSSTGEPTSEVVAAREVVPSKPLVEPPAAPRVDPEPIAPPEAEAPTGEVPTVEAESKTPLVDNLPPLESAVITPAPQRIADEPNDATRGAEAPRVALADRATETAPPEPAGPPSPIDPLAFDPTEAVMLLRPGAAPTPGDEPPSVEERPASDPAKPPSLDDQLARAARRAGVFVERGPSGPDAIRSVASASKALTHVTPAIALRGVPLDEALRLLGRIAGAPITIDPDALRYAGVAPDKPIDIVGEGRSIGDLLAASLKPWRLAYEVEGRHVVVTRPGADRQREVTHRLGDLAGSDNRSLVEDLLALVGSEGSFDLTEDGVLTLDATMATHYELRILCERLRLARGRPRQTKYPRDLLATDSSLAVLDQILSRRATFSFVEPTPLDEIVDHWRRATGLSILVDWRSLADAGLGPQATIACSVTNRAWRDGLDGVLGPLGLGWTALDGETLWLSTNDALADRATLELVTVAPENAEAVRNDLQNRNPSAIFVYDAESSRLVVRGGAAAQREAARSVSP